MKACLALRGIVTVLKTPLTAGNKLDPAALRRHACKALAARVAGFLVPGMASEVGKLTPAERELSVDTVECVRAGKVEVVPAGRKYSELLAATGGRLHVSGGWAAMQMIEALDRSVHAFMRG